MFNNIFEKIGGIEMTPAKDLIIRMLQETWKHTKPLAHTQEMVSCPNVYDADTARAHTYCRVNMWEGTSMQQALTYWNDMSINEQNTLLIEAFADGKEY